MAYKDKDEFLDAFYDHMFPEGGDEPTDDDKQWFDDVVSKFFDQFDTNDGGQGGQGGPNPPRRRRPSQRTNTTRRRRSGATSDSGYGNKTFFGS